MAQDLTQTARVLKVVVIVLGVMIALGVAVLVAGLLGRAGKIASREGAPRFATVALALPGRVAAMADAGDGALTLLVEGADGAQALVTVDRESGAVLGTLTLQPTR